MQVQQIKKIIKNIWVRKQGVDSSLPIKQYWWKCKGYVIHKKNGHKAVCRGNVTERSGAVFSIYQLTPRGIAVANLHKVERQTVFWEWPLYVIGLYSHVIALFTKCCCQWHIWGHLDILGGCGGFCHSFAFAGLWSGVAMAGYYLMWWKKRTCRVVALLQRRSLCKSLKYTFICPYFWLSPTSSRQVHAVRNADQLHRQTPDCEPNFAKTII